MKSAPTPAVFGTNQTLTLIDGWMDKDRFRRDLGNVENAYQQVLERVLAQTAISGQ